MRQLAAVVTSATLALGFVGRIAADTPAAQAVANSHAVYTALRNLGLSGESHAVQAFVLKKDAATSR